MDIDPLEAVEAALEKKEAEDQQREGKLNTWVALTVAVLATFLGICKVTDDNVVQAMQQAQADRLDYWNYYQARNVRQDVTEATLLQLRINCAGAAEAAKTLCAESIERHEKRVEEHKVRRAELKAQAEDAEKRYATLNDRDDQFDLSDAALAIAIALLAVTALTHLWWLYWFSMVPTGFGILMGVAGLGQLPIHVAWLVKWLS